MTPPIWLDEHGRRGAARPCPRCGAPTPVGRTFRLEHLRMMDLQLFTEAQIVAVVRRRAALPRGAGCGRRAGRAGADSRGGGASSKRLKTGEMFTQHRGRLT